jgi:hypothetical protein
LSFVHIEEALEAGESDGRSSRLGLV